ncbi:carbohydrate ABC transporter permease [Promicromonospora thailandica]|uniref:Sorbitol/mannitol transport system permease protein n=1 Tax=Promicromonospora thailandica TaxID=765201 RepID=A0A9X2JWY0_9MICO|nr:sugar ABC transporter permease [Promicromonospora thailandica]MCP2266027.1 sorbitol/mannitol transport system permease protein [Promicromonospora thailandica]
MTTLMSPPTVRRPRRPAAGPAGRRSRLAVSRALLWPALATSIVLTQIPFVVTIYYSLQRWNMLRPGDRGFTGLDNYASVLRDGSFLSSLGSTVAVTGSSVVLSTLLGLLFAVLLDRSFVGRGVARTLMITPFLVMPAAAALVWKWSILDAATGMANWGLGLVGLPPVAWNTEVPIVTIILVLTWQYTPFAMLILLAGLQAQNKDVLEAAAVDGAGAFRTFTAITLPHLRQYVEIAVLLASIMLLQVFDPIAIMTRGTGGTKTLSYLLYERAFVGLEVGEAAAYGVMTVLVTIVVASVALRTLFKVFSREGIDR